MRPWIFQLGPLFVTVDAREELALCAHNLSQKDYTDLIWANRVAEKRPAQRHRSKSWPTTIYDRKLRGYVLTPYIPSNVTPIRKQKS